jgi:hypothetical protein
MRAKTILCIRAGHPDAERAGQPLVPEKYLSRQRPSQAGRLRHEMRDQAHVPVNPPDNCVSFRRIDKMAAMRLRNLLGDLQKQSESDRPQPKPNGDHEQKCAQKVALPNWIERVESVKRPLDELRPGPWQPGDPGD